MLKARSLDQHILGICQIFQNELDIKILLQEYLYEKNPEQSVSYRTLIQARLGENEW